MKNTQNFIFLSFPWSRVSPHSFGNSSFSFQLFVYKPTLFPKWLWWYHLEYMNLSFWDLRRFYPVKRWFGFLYMTDLENHKSNNQIQHQYQSPWNHQSFGNNFSFNLKWSWENIPPIPYLTSITACMDKICFQARILEYLWTILHHIYEIRKIENSSPGEPLHG